MQTAVLLLHFLRLRILSTLLCQCASKLEKYD
jgi:hypothetical protein